MRRLLALTLAVLMVGMLFVPAAAANDLEYGDDRAELEIYQPPWVDEEVSVDRSDNRTIYDVSGDEYQIQLTNVDHEHIERVDVADGAATIEYDERRNVYLVEPEGEGTISLYWDAEEPVFDDEGNETGEIEQTRYAASLQVSDTQWTHLSEEQYEQTRNDAGNWSEVESEADQIGVSTDWMLSVGIGFAEFASNPTGQFIEGVQATVMIMTLDPGGLFVLSVFLLLIAITAAAGFRWKHRYKKDVGDHDRAKEELDEAWLSKPRKIAQQWDWPEILPDHLAQWMFDNHGPNVWYGLKDYQLLRSSLHTKGLLLQLMTQLGYRGVAHYDGTGNVVKARALTRDEYEDEYGGINVEGGDGDDDGDTPDVVDVDGGEFEPDGGVLETEEIETINFEELRFDDPHHRDIIAAIPADDLDESVFLPSVDLDLSRVSLPIDNHDVEDTQLVKEFEPQIPGDFESYEQFARVHAKMLETAVNHPYYTDKDGNVREEMDLLSFLSELDSVLADKAEFPVADTQRKMLYMIADELDADNQVDETLEDAYTHGVGRNDEDSADVIGPEDIDLGGPRPGGDPV